MTSSFEALEYMGKKQITFLAGLLSALVFLGSTAQAFQITALSIRRDAIEPRYRAGVICERMNDRFSSGEGVCDDDTFPPNQPVCGNNVVEQGEQCDGSAPAGKICNSQCVIEDVWQEIQCGNGIVESGEQCDGSAPAGFVCTAVCQLQEQPGDGGNDNGGNDDGTVSIANGKIIINEIYAAVDSPARGLDPQHEWIELFNADAKAIDLFGWQIKDTYATADVFTSHLVLQPGEFALVTWASSAFATYWSGIAPAQTKVIALDNPIGDGLSELGEALELWSSSRVDEVSYGSNQRIYMLPALSQGQSLVRVSAGTDSNKADDWTVSNSPTPGF